MARPGGNPDLKGKKGRSGRKSTRDESLRNEVILKAWLKKQKRMTDQDATQIVLKDMGEKIKGDKDNPIFIQQITGMEIIEDNEDSIQDKNQEADSSN
jgi:hypothetical protein